MSKVKKAFFCQNCGYESVKWIGQCPSCNQWNSFVEEIIQKENAKTNGWEHYNETTERTNKTIQLNEIKSSEEKRCSPCCCGAPKECNEKERWILHSLR